MPAWKKTSQPLKASFILNTGRRETPSVSKQKRRTVRWSSVVPSQLLP